MNNRQSVRERATTKSFSQVMSPRRAFLGRQRGKYPPILLMTKGKVMMKGKERKKREKRVRMRVMREEKAKNTGEKMTGTRVRTMREPLKEEVQEALGMATLIHLFSPKCGSSMTSSRQ